LAIAWVALGFAACSSSSGGAGDLCGKLGSISSCGSSATDTCNKAIAAQKQQTPNCSAIIDAFAQCLAGLSLDCSSGGIADCASGLTCTQGECTRPCMADSDCKARAGGCQLSTQQGNVCTKIGGAFRCTMSCSFGDTSTCQFLFGSTYTCTTDTSLSTQSCVPM
jgi:hypothetical protein